LHSSLSSLTWHGSSTTSTPGQDPSEKLLTPTASPDPPLEEKANGEKYHSEGSEIRLNDFLARELSLRGVQMEKWFEYSDSIGWEEDESVDAMSMIPADGTYSMKTYRSFYSDSGSDDDTESSDWSEESSDDELMYCYRNSSSLSQ